MARGEHHRIHAQDRVRRNRHRVAQEAARLMSEHGIRDFHHAKLKAAGRLGIQDEQSLPRNREIEAALREHQRLFHADSQAAALALRREAALEAMRFLAPFRPRLVGAVLDGTADRHSAVCLHLFSDDGEAVVRFLGERAIPFETLSRRLRVDRDRAAEYQVLKFNADGVPFDLTVLPLDGLRQAPIDRIDERPMRRASLAALEALIAVEEPCAPADYAGAV